MLLQYLTNNFMTLMLLSALITVIIVNRGRDIPATSYFSIIVAVIFLITVTDTISDWAAGDIKYQFFSADPSVRIGTRVIASAIGYILRPLVVMMQVLIISPFKGRNKWLIAVPAIVNAAVFSTAFFGSHMAFWISDSNRFERGPMGFTIYFVMLFYVFLLALFSVIYFKSDDISRSAIVFLIVIQSVIVAMLEGTNILAGYVMPVAALGTLEYYFYLSVIYQGEMRETIAEKELHLTRQQMTLLRNQIQPHFIFNSLSIIRSLAKRDSKKAVECIDSFSEYLKAHIYFIQDDELVSFDKELDNVGAYLDLVQSDSVRNVQVEYDLGVTDFMIPPLTLEPVVENAIKHGIGMDGGKIVIKTYEQDGSSIITVSDSGKGSPDKADQASSAPSAASSENADKVSSGMSKTGMTEKEEKRLGVGIANTRRRLKMQCNGTLETKLSDTGSVVTITIPKKN